MWATYEIVFIVQTDIVFCMSSVETLKYTNKIRTFVFCFSVQYFDLCTVPACPQALGSRTPWWARRSSLVWSLDSAALCSAGSYRRPGRERASPWRSPTWRSTTRKSETCSTPKGEELFSLAHFKLRSHAHISFTDPACDVFGPCCVFLWLCFDTSWRKCVTQALVCNLCDFVLKWINSSCFQLSLAELYLITVHVSPEIDKRCAWESTKFWGLMLTACLAWLWPAIRYGRVFFMNYISTVFFFDLSLHCAAKGEKVLS